MEVASLIIMQKQALELRRSNDWPTRARISIHRQDNHWSACCRSLVAEDHSEDGKQTPLQAVLAAADLFLTSRRHYLL